MAGTLYYVSQDQRPKAGDRVWILVDDVNYPTGFWEGVLVSVGGDYPKYPEMSNFAAQCTAVITDSKLKPNAPRVARTASGHGIPTVNYMVMDAPTAVVYLQNMRDADRREIEGLKRRLEIEKATFLTVIKALSSPGAFTDFKKLVEDMLKQLKGR